MDTRQTLIGAALVSSRFSVAMHAHEADIFHLQ
jgi:hypothetical protein